MPILKLHLENVGPFDALELDFTKPDGSAHLGPHILTGVNGSGKTTVLKAIAACLAEGVRDSLLDRVDHGFSLAEDWHPRTQSRAGGRCTMHMGASSALAWEVRGPTPESRDVNRAKTTHGKGTFEELSEDQRTYQLQVPETESVLSLGCVAAYTPSPKLRRIPQPPTGHAEGILPGWLSFDSSVSNDSVQAFWIHAFLRKAYQSDSSRVEALDRVMKLVLGADFGPGLKFEGTFGHPALELRGSSLGFSQLAAGYNATIGWLVDFLMRQEVFPWRNAEAANKRPGVLLIDEVDTHLHPQWQRRILKGIRAAFPNTQIIATTHSPFVVTSCEEARVHTFQVDRRGKATLKETRDGMDGVSMSAAIDGVFGIQSQFGPEVETMLRDWNELKKLDHVGKLKAKDKTKLRTLSRKIAARGEELASLVADPPVLPASLIEELVAAAASGER